MDIFHQTADKILIKLRGKNSLLVHAVMSACTEDTDIKL